MYKMINVYKILTGKIQGKKDHLEGLDTFKDYTTMDFRKTGYEDMQNYIQQWLLCLGFHNKMEFLEQFNGYQLLKEECILCS